MVGAGVSLSLKQRQSLKLSPQQQLSTRLLGMNARDLEAYIAEAAATNPLLKPVAPQASMGHVRSAPGNSPIQGAPHDDARLWELLEDNPPSLAAHIEQQLGLLPLTPAQRRLAERVSAYLEPSGYLDRPPAPLAQSLGVTPAVLAPVLKQLRSLEPAGLFAYDLQDCLTLQLEDQGRMTPILQKLLPHLSALAHQSKTQLAAKLQLSPQALDQALGQLRGLNPKPGLAFEPDMPPPPSPDVRVYQDTAGGWRVSLITEALPSLSLDEALVEAIATAPTKSMQDKLREARWLEAALKQRAETLLRVTASIVLHQQAFFQDGLLKLKPLNLQSVADGLGLHISTISRATRDKYLDSPQGTFELKYFFPAGIATQTPALGGANRAIQARIQALIATEPRNKPYSDDKLVQLLAEQGITLARRTVTKYREALGLAASPQRKRQYA